MNSNSVQNRGGKCDPDTLCDAKDALSEAGMRINRRGICGNVRSCESSGACGTAHAIPVLIDVILVLLTVLDGAGHGDLKVLQK